MRFDKVVNGELTKATKPKKGRRYIWPEAVTKIGPRAFYNWTDFDVAIEIPTTVTEIGDQAFAGWRRYNQPTTIPEGVTKIGKAAFDLWEAMNSNFTLPNSLTEIGDRAFSHWKSFNQSFSIPESVKSAGGDAFNRWNSFKQKTDPHTTEVMKSAKVTPDSTTDKYDDYGRPRQHRSDHTYDDNDNVVGYVKAVKHESTGIKVPKDIDATQIAAEIRSIERAMDTVREKMKTKPSKQRQYMDLERQKQDRLKLLKYSTVAEGTELSQYAKALRAIFD